MKSLKLNHTSTVSHPQDLLGLLVAAAAAAASAACRTALLHDTTCWQFTARRTALYPKKWCSARNAPCTPECYEHNRWPGGAAADLQPDNVKSTVLLRLENNSNVLTVAPSASTPLLYVHSNIETICQTMCASHTAAPGSTPNTPPLPTLARAQQALPPAAAATCCPAAVLLLPPLKPSACCTSLSACQPCLWGPSALQCGVAVK